MLDRSHEGGSDVARELELPSVVEESFDGNLCSLPPFLLALLSLLNVVIVENVSVVFWLASTFFWGAAPPSTLPISLEAASARPSSFGPAFNTLLMQLMAAAHRPESGRGGTLCMSPACAATGRKSSQ